MDASEYSSWFQAELRAFILTGLLRVRENQAQKISLREQAHRLIGWHISGVNGFLQKFAEKFSAT
jgi:hypothetical protein